MSTGDQSEYLRKKMAERRANYDQGGDFMRSGFQRWAENERPARQGGAMKEALATASMDAGKDILDRVKSLGEDMYAQFYKGQGHHVPGNCEGSESESEEEDALEGGFRFYGNPITAAKQADASLFRKAFGMGMPMGAEDEHVKEGMGYSGVGYSGNGMTVSKTAYMPVSRLTPGQFAALAQGQPIKGMTLEQHAGMVQQAPKSLPKGKGKLEEHAMDLLRMAKKGKKKGGYGDSERTAAEERAQKAPMKYPRGKGKLECVHHEEGHGTHIRKGKGVGSYVGKTVLKKGADMAIDKAFDGKGHGGILPLAAYGAYKTQQAMKGHIAKGRGFKEGVIESKKVANDVGDVAISGYEVYEDLSNGNILNAIDKSKSLVQSGLSAANHAKSAAAEFGKMGSGRATRAAIVKRIMKEKGLSLPEASKYVKEHGLYKK